MMNEYITPNYETIGVAEKRKIVRLYTSSLINAFTYEDYLKAIALIMEAVDRLEEQDNE